MNQASNFYKKVVLWAGSRLALNIYFWLFLVVIKQSDADDQNIYSKSFYFAVMLFYMLFFAALSYINNIILLPKLLFLKKRITYFIAAFLLLFTIAFLYTYTLKIMPKIYPGLNLEMSIIMSPITAENSFNGVLNDLESYFSFMLLWLVVFSLAGIYHHSIRKIKLMEAEINSNREAELTFLKNQINPHFLFNTLNNLYALTLKKSDEAPAFILKLSTILRYILYESDTFKISFDKEKEIIQAYLDIELLRVTNSSINNFTIYADKPTEIPPLLWLPILENVFIHNRTVETLEIDFKFTIQNNELTLFCKNNISKFPASLNKQEGGIGLSNLQKRLKLVYPNKHELIILNDEKSFIIDLKIKLN
ncbi:MAG: sensor histidine kinase [Bacteroidia bacterium]